MGCPDGHLEPTSNCKWCHMAINKDVRYLKLWFGISEPSLLTKTLTFAGAVTSHVVTGMQCVDDKTYGTRLQTCNGCAFYSSQKDSCVKCGCRMKIKARWKEQKCPLKLWEE